MKKNLVFKLGLFCAALVLVATCFVTNAWAKYTKTTLAWDEARVAKFDVSTEIAETEIQTGTQQIEIFDTAFNHIYNANDKGTDGKKLIAPGSTGTFDIVLTNTSEVTVEYDLKAVDTNTGLIPLVWSADGESAGSLAGLLTLLGKQTLAATDGVTPSTKTITVTWSWAYTGGNDAYDTELGEKTDLDTYKVEITCIATQVAPNAA